MKTDTLHYRVVIIEDEQAHQEMLIGLLAEQGNQFEVCGVAGDIGSGKELITRCEPDLVFMDVILPPYDCFELLKSLDEIPFKIIFTTSHDAYAVRAFRLSAIDYLLKPLDATEFHSAIEKFKNKVEGEDSTAHVQNMLSNMHVSKAEHARIALPTLTGFRFMPVREIVRCQSDNTYTTFFTLDKKSVVVSRTLKECEHMLGEFRFFRVHNSHLVNMEYVVEYTRGEGGMIRMIDGSNIDVSRRRKEEFLRELQTP